MAQNFSLNFGKELETIAKKVVKDTLEELYIEIQKKSPVKSGKFIAQNRVLGVRIEGDSVIGEIVNEGEYSEKVESGWKQKPVRWHMHDGSIFFSKGAETYKRALLKVKTNFLKRLG